MKKRKRKKIPKPRLQITRECPNCRSTDLVIDESQGNQTCRTCSVVMEMSLLSRDRFASGSMNQHRTVSSPPSRKLRESHSKIEVLCSKLPLHQKYVQKAKDLFNDLSKINALRGKSEKVIIAACVFISCKILGYARTHLELCTAQNIQKKDLLTSIRFIEKTLKLRETGKSNYKEPTNPATLALRYCQYLELSKPVCYKVDNACRTSHEKHLFIGKKPNTVASGIIYLVTMEEKSEDDRKSPEEISKVSGVAASTITRFYKKELIARKHVLIGEEV